MSEARHCRHCWGDCHDECLIGQPGMCIHGWNGKRPRRFRWQLLSRKWWHRGAPRRPVRGDRADEFDLISRL